VEQEEHRVAAPYDELGPFNRANEVCDAGAKLELHLDLTTAPGRSLRARTEHALREAVRSGRLAPGTRLPATRALAVQLGVSRGVVVDAYAQLAAEGYLQTRRGGGTTVAAAPVDAQASRGAPVAPAPSPAALVPRYDLRPGLPAIDGFPRAVWLAALTRVLRSVPDARLGYGAPEGEPELRTALGGALARTRGVRAAPEQVIITTGTRHGTLPLLWRLLAARGARRVGIEHPGWRGFPQTLALTGLEAVPLPVDEDGLDPAGLRDLRLDAVVVTPAHQYPTGAVLSAERRAALVEWARGRGTLLVEDDYDAEFRYDRQPIGSLQGLAPELVAYCGSTSKTLAPALGIAWVVLPSILAATLERDGGLIGGTAPALDQLALADLYERGEVDRHLRRQRHRYRRRRDALLTALAQELPGVEVRGAAAGLFAVLLLGAEVDEGAVVAAAGDRGIALEGLAAPGRRGLVIGYANLPEAAAGPAVRALSQALSDHGSGANGRADVTMPGRV
jgi:GntR family transcriptional regulator/MocR family aminotransferase